MARRRDLTASMRIAVSDPNAILRVRSSSQRKGWAKAWEYYDNVGEVHFALNEVGREMSRIRLIGQRRNTDGVWKTVEPNDKLQVAIDGIQSYNGGQGQLLRSYYINHKVVGETMLVIYDKDGQVWYDACSPDEIDIQEGVSGRGENRLVRRMVPSSDLAVNTATSFEELPDDTDVIRFWTPHPRWSMIADSPLLSLDIILDELQILTRSLKNKLTSRLALNGFWFIPNSIQEISGEMPTGDPTKLPSDPLVAKLVKAMTDGILDTVGPGAAMPFIMRGPDDAGEKIRLEFPDRELFTAEIALREELISRAMAGLDIHKQTAEGTSDSNHWSAWAGQEIHLNNQVAPEVEAFAAGMNKDWLPRVPGLDPETERLWYTTDELTQRPNKAEDARQVVDRAAMSDIGLRIASGIPEEFAPDNDEKIRAIGRIIRNPYLATYGLPEQDDFDWGKVNPGKAPGVPAGPDDDSPAGPGVGDPGSPGDNDSDTRKGDRPGG